MARGLARLKPRKRGQTPSAHGVRPACRSAPRASDLGSLDPRPRLQTAPPSATLSRLSRGPTGPSHEVRTMRRLSMTVLASLLLAVNALGAPGDDLLEAAGNGDLAKVNAALKAGAGVDFKGSDGTTALMLAAAANNAKLVNLLLAKGAKLDERDGSGVTALMVAVDRNNTAIARTLIGKGADVNAAENEGRTALLLAAARGNDALLKLLLAKGAD
ncbi:MAG TPA: hypothetical protein DFS52_06395, partial [Myxococcales bacterium]|nr:hypothetical protein [Myxococcales bacterium]